MNVVLPGHRMENVEVLRGLAALSVAWFHFTQGSFFQDRSALQASGAYGYLGVEVFFVISGFIIPYAMAQRGYALCRDGWVFAVRRLIRLEPAYLASIALVVVLGTGSALFSPNVRFPANSGEALLSHVAYLAPWLDVPWLNPVYWSLAIEFQYYAFILLLAPLLLSEQIWRVRCFLAITALGSLLHEARLVTFYLPLFAFGFIRFAVLARRLSLIEAIAWIVGTCVVGQHLGLPAIAAGLFALAVLSVRMPFVPRSVLALGAISYSLYLVHVPVGGRVINLAARLPALWYTQVAALALALALSILVATAFYYFIEQPTAKLSHAFRSRLHMA